MNGVGLGISSIVLLVLFVFSVVLLVLTIFLPFFVYRIRKESIDTNKLLRSLISEIKSLHTEIIKQSGDGKNKLPTGFITLKSKTGVRQAPNSSLIFTVNLEAGTAVRVISARDGWSQIQTFDNPGEPLGWIEDKDLE